MSVNAIKLTWTNNEQ